MNTLPSLNNGSDRVSPSAIVARTANNQAGVRMVKRRLPTGEVVETPVSTGAVVKMKLSRRPSPELRSFVANHLVQMADNPNFPDQQPPPEVLQALFDTFSADLANVSLAKIAYEAALTKCDSSRTALEQGMQMRGAYVQAKSNGNVVLIMNSGLDVKKDPTPVGQLPAPLHLSVELNGVTGLMKFRWPKVKNARGYLLEYSPDVTPRQFAPLANTTKTRFETLLSTGENYVFRVAAFGGSTGQSYYSAEVVRRAA